MSAVIEVRGLVVRYPGASVDAVKGVDLDLRAGEILGLLGPSGAGKSTTQRALTGRLRRFEGQVRVFGEDMRAPSAALFERVGVSFETANLYTRLSARENLALFSALYAGPAPDFPALLARVGLADALDQRVSEMSKGMRLRLNLSRALLNRPELLFLDEPSAGQDPVNRARIRRLIREERDRGAAVLVTTHDMHLAAELCDRVGFIVDGRLAALDTPAALSAMAGPPAVRVVLVEGEERRFALDGLLDDPDFVSLMRARRVQALHSTEADLEQVFHQVTGQRLVA